MFFGGSSPRSCLFSERLRTDFSEVRIQHIAYPWPHGTQGWTRGAYVVHTRHVAICYMPDLAQRWMKTLRRHDGTHIALVHCHSLVDL